MRADKPSTIQTVHQQTAALGLSLIPSDFIADPSSACYTIRRLAEEYREDMSATFVDGGSLHAELGIWSSAISALTNPLDNVQETLKLTTSDNYPQLHLLLRLVSTFPITSCETERSVSKLRRLKNYLRSTMN